jgi:hypothetical protein
MEIAVDIEEGYKNCGSLEYVGDHIFELGGQCLFPR